MTGEPARGHVAVCIVGFRNPGDILRCLTALGASTYADFEVVICENGGTAAYEALCAVLPTALAGGQTMRTLQRPDNPGFAGGVNACFGEAPDADAWWVLNPDTGPSAEALAIQMERLSAGDCDAVGCTLVLPDGKVQSHGGRWRPWLARAESIGIGSRLDEPVDAAAVEREQSYLNGASMLIGRRFLETVGPMREDYFLYCEEVEWCLRGSESGMRLGFALGAIVLHERGTTTGSGEPIQRRPKLPIYYGERNKILLTRDRYPSCLPVAAMASLALFALRCARGGAWRAFLYGLSGWWAGLLDERGVQSP
jgi:GT2 family glycosyltransferase